MTYKNKAEAQRVIADVETFVERNEQRAYEAWSAFDLLGARECTRRADAFRAQIASIRALLPTLPD